MLHLSIYNIVILLLISSIGALLHPTKHRLPRYNSALEKKSFQKFSRISILSSSSRSTDDEDDDDQKWELMFRSWKERKDNDYGDSSSSLEEWATEQRMRYEKDSLSVSRLSKLKSIGFIDDDDVRKKVNADNWETMYEELLSFREEHGHCNVDGEKYFVQYPALTIWTIGQREWKCRRNMYIAGEAAEQFLSNRIRRLDDIGFDWQSENYFFGSSEDDIKEEIIQKRWNKKFDELLQFKKENGHYDVPHFYFENPSLGFFVKSQRSWPTGTWGEYPTLWKEELDRIGFTWEI